LFANIFYLTNSLFAECCGCRLPETVHSSPQQEFVDLWTTMMRTAIAKAEVE